MMWLKSENAQSFVLFVPKSCEFMGAEDLRLFANVGL